MYHGVSEQYIDVWTHVTVEAFKKQMAYISRHYTPITMHKALKHLDNEKTVTYPVVVTFDDGFRNNLSHAHPVLKQYDIPAVIYLTTSFIDGKGFFEGLIWTDYVHGLLRSAKVGNYDLSHIGLGEISIGDAVSRFTAKKDLCSKLKVFSNVSRLEAIKRLGLLLGTTIARRDRNFFTGMNWDDVRTLEGDGLVTLGAHTVNHPILTRLDQDQAQYEIAAPQGIIENQTGRKTDFFAYPNGTREDFNDDIKNIVTQHYISAVSTIEGFNDAKTDRFELRRFGIGNDMPIWEFKLRLSGVIDLFKSN
jgi:peptidoglycan/xylan/chitin deacetylase (PgdA/CDA1 family)